MILQFSQIRFTDVLIFIFTSRLFSNRMARVSIRAESVQGRYSRYTIRPFVRS